jgi:transporter family-2 protein
MTTQLIPALVALACGILLSLQVAINSRLGRGLGSGLIAASASFIVGLIGLLVLCLVMRQRMDWATAGRVPWWSWLGGLMGAFYIAATIMLLPRIGSAALVGLVIGGQLAAALVLDHYGWLGVPEHALNLPRLIGAALLLAGVALVLRY